MDVTPHGMTSVTFTLLDALFNQLIEKGVLTDADQVAIYQRAHAALTAAEDPQMREAAALLEHLYKST
jgi:hypothetical protein